MNSKIRDEGEGGLQEDGEEDENIGRSKQEEVKAEKKESKRNRIVRRRMKGMEE